MYWWNWFLEKNNYSGMCNIGFYIIDLKINNYVK